MTKLNRFFLLVFNIFLFSCASTEIGVMDFPDGEIQHVVYGDKIKWQKCPPNLPKGCELSILEGHPGKPDFFTVRFKADEALYMPPHTHPKDERVTVIKGNVSVAFGLNAKHEDAVHLGPGDYYVNARNHIHAIWVDTPAIIQITGIGPWETNFVSNE